MLGSHAEADDAVVSHPPRFSTSLRQDANGAGCRQVVLVAAGQETRAYRLARPEGVRSFELDLLVTGSTDTSVALADIPKGSTRAARPGPIAGLLGARTP
jgi:hypothetical protein